MSPHLKRTVAALVALLALGGVASGAEPSVALDALSYTVVRTPPAERIPVLPLERDRNVLTDRVRVFPDREVPPVFWYDAGIHAREIATPDEARAMLRIDKRSPYLKN